MTPSHDDFLVVYPQAAAAAASTSQEGDSSDAQTPQRSNTVVVSQVPSASSTQGAKVADPQVPQPKVHSQTPSVRQQ